MSLVDDSQPHREAIVAQNKKKAKNKAFQKHVSKPLSIHVIVGDSTLYFVIAI